MLTTDLLTQGLHLAYITTSIDDVIPMSGVLLLLLDERAWRVGVALMSRGAAPETYFESN